MPNGEVLRLLKMRSVEAEDRLDHGQMPLVGDKQVALLPRAPQAEEPLRQLDGLELVYQYTGKSDWTVGAGPIRMRQGDLLLLGTQVPRRMYKVGTEDVLAHFLVSMDFLQGLLKTAANPSPQREFMLNCLLGAWGGQGCLHFQVAEDIPIQNLVENLLAALLATPCQTSVSRMTMTLLLAQLFTRSDTIPWRRQDRVVWEILTYIEENYAQGSLTQLSKQMGRDVSFLSRELHRRMGKTYTDLVQEQRMYHAAKLLRETDMRVNDIARQVGYENISYFHRLFYAAYNTTPGHYRNGR